MGDPALIAIIDDDASARNAARSLIGSMGFAVATFSSAEAFLGSDVAGRTDCLVVDMRMTHMTGHALHDRFAVAGRTIPTIVTTEVPQAASRRWTREAGVVACLPKPLEPESLTVALRGALERNDEER